MQRQDIIKRFREYGIIKFGSFTLKDGSTSPFYIDLRMLTSYPRLFSDVCKELARVASKNGFHYKLDHVVGLPYAGIPIGTTVALELDMSSLLMRKEAKDYGCKNMIEGVYKEGDTVLLVDDVVTSATSKREAIAMLEKHGLKCGGILVIVDRRNQEINDLEIHSLFTVQELLEG